MLFALLFVFNFSYWNLLLYIICIYIPTLAPYQPADHPCLPDRRSFGTGEAPAGEKDPKDLRYRHPPPSRSPSPDPPAFQPFREQPLVDQDPKLSSPEKPPAPRRSSRKRTSPADDEESPPKRRKTVVIRPPLPITPAATMDTSPLPPPKPITVESFVGFSPTFSNHDAGVYFWVISPILYSSPRFSDPLGQPDQFYRGPIM